MSEQPAEALGPLPPELAGGPSVDVWAPTATLLPSLDDDEGERIGGGALSRPRAQGDRM